MGRVDPHIVRIEERLAHLERHLEQLDEVVRDLHQRQDAISARLTRLGEQTKRDLAALSDGPRELEDDEPPHWGRKS